MSTVVNQEITDHYAIYNADCVEVARSLPSDSIDFSVFSPPFEQLYCYSNIDRDFGNSKDSAEFWTHYRFLITEQFRIHKPGRLVSIHCMNLPTSKAMHGYIGLRDFRGEIIRAYQEAGFIYHSEVVVWKNPVTAMQRTKALGLLYKQLKTDSAMSRQGIPDYLVTFRKPGKNPDPINHYEKTKDAVEASVKNDLDASVETQKVFTVDKWQNYASPVWMDINPSRTLQYMSARDPDDQKHVCPLQLDVIERAIELWTNPNDLVYTPFLGIGSEVYCAVKMGRRGIGSELKPSYFKVAVDNCRAAIQELKDAQVTLFDGEAA